MPFRFTLRTDSGFNDNEQWIVSGSFSSPKPEAFIRCNSRHDPWPIAATMYRIYEDNRRAGSPASIVDRRGSPRWYAVWALIRYLRSVDADLTRRSGRRLPSGECQSPEIHAKQSLQIGGTASAISHKGSLSEHCAANPTSVAFAPRNSRVRSAMIENPSGMSGNETTSTDIAVTRLPPRPSSHNPDSAVHNQPHAEVRRPARTLRSKSSSPFTGNCRSRKFAEQVRSTLSRAATMLSGVAPTTGALSHDGHTPVNSLSRLQNFVASKIEQNDRAQKSAEERFSQGLGEVKGCEEKVLALKAQVIEAGKELTTATRRQESLLAAKEKQDHIVQRYHDYQKDLKHLALMQDEKVKGLRALNVPSFERTLVASMSPMIQGVLDKYPDVLRE